jgi:acyl-coenzyme A synthetase/AMP-(fatty) acid ligase
LRAILANTADLSGRRLASLGREVAFEAIRDGTALAGRLPELAGRSVLVCTDEQISAGLALIELDGIVRRLVIAPPDLRREHLASVVADAGIDAVVTDRDPATFEGIGTDLLVRCGGPLVPAMAPLPQAETEWVLLTSGTTGAPKMVVHDLRGLTGAIKPRPASDAPIVWATFYDIRRYGGLQIFLRAVLGATSLILSSAGESSVEHLQRLAEAGVTHISGTPSHWRRALMSQAATAIAPSYVRLSGEIADQAVLDSLRQLYPQASVGHAYASTEAGVGFEVDDGLEGFPASYLERRGDVEMKLVAGSLHIRSNRTASHYVTAGSSLADAEGFVDTGDMIEQRGERCYFVGRRGGIINVGGLKVHPEEVEAVINSHGRVRMSLVKARKSPIMGSIVIADVVLTEAEADPDAVKTLKGEILHLCRDALPVHKVPATIRFVPALDVTSGGKLARPHA